MTRGMDGGEERRVVHGVVYPFKLLCPLLIKDRETNIGEQVYVLQVV